VGYLIKLHSGSNSELTEGAHENKANVVVSANQSPTYLANNQKLEVGPNFVHEPQSLLPQIEVSRQQKRISLSRTFPFRLRDKLHLNQIFSIQQWDRLHQSVWWPLISWL